MKINRNELLNVLSAVKPGLANKEILEQSTHFIFKEGEVYTYNDQITISHVFESGIDGIAVKAEAFFKLLQKIKTEEIELSIDENKLLITAGKTKAGIAIETEIKIKQLDIPEEWDKLPNNFSEGIKLGLFSTGKDMTREFLTCLSVEKKQIISCDNHRATVIELDDKIKTPFLLSGSSAVELIKYKPTDYRIDDNWLHFINEEDVVFSCRAVGLEYPSKNIIGLFTAEGTKIEFPKDLLETIDRVSTLAITEFDQDKFITLELSKNKMLVKGESSSGWVTEEINIEYKGKEVIIKIHPMHFTEVLNHMNQAVLSENSILFSSDKFKHTISLVS